MPSLTVSFVPGSGYVPILHSGFPTFLSGRIEPIGGLQLLAAKTNSGPLFISLSGANVYSGQMSTLATSGGPTIRSGGHFLSGGCLSGLMDGMELSPGTAYFTPRISIPNTGWNSGIFNICVACSPEGSGIDRLYWELF